MTQKFPKVTMDTEDGVATESEKINQVYFLDKNHLKKDRKKLIKNLMKVGKQILNIAVPAVGAAELGKRSFKIFT